DARVAHGKQRTHRRERDVADAQHEDQQRAPRSREQSIEYGHVHHQGRGSGPARPAPDPSINASATPHPHLWCARCGPPVESMPYSSVPATCHTAGTAGRKFVSRGAAEPQGRWATSGARPRGRGWAAVWRSSLAEGAGGLERLSHRGTEATELQGAGGGPGLVGGGVPGGATLRSVRMFDPGVPRDTSSYPRRVRGAPDQTPTN